MKSRDVARVEMPAALRREVRLLGDLLGEVLAEYGGPELLGDVEQLRRTVIAARESDDDERARECAQNTPLAPRGRTARYQ